MLTRSLRLPNVHGPPSCPFIRSYIHSSLPVHCRHPRCRSKISLNKIAEDSTFNIIQRALDDGVNITDVYVDTVGDAGRYEQRLSQRFPTLKFTGGVEGLKNHFPVFSLVFEEGRGAF